MSESTIGVDDAATPDKYLHTDQRTYGGTAKEDQYVLTAQPTYATYTAIGSNVSLATSGAHLMYLQGDGTNYTRLNRIWIRQAESGTGNVGAEFHIYRTTTAGTGGSTIPAHAFDTGDTTPYAGTAMVLPSGKGTEGARLLTARMAIASSPVNYLNEWRWEAKNDGLEKPIIVGQATSSGIVVKNIQPLASATVDITFEFTTTATL